MALTDSSRLGCGREVDDLWANIGHEPDEHETTCPYCQRAREDLADLASATTAINGADDTDRRFALHPGTMAAIMAIVRTEVRRGATLPLLAESPDEPREPGELSISELAVATIVHAACDGFDQIEGRRCRVGVADEKLRTSTGLTGAPNPLKVELSLTVAYPANIPSLVSELRGAVIEVVQRRVGVPVASVVVHVEDFHNV